MLRILIALPFMIAAFAGTAGHGIAEVMRPDLGMGLTDYLATVGNPVPDIEPIPDAPSADIPAALMVDPRELHTQGRADGISAKLMLDPQTVDVQVQAAAAAAWWNFWTYMAILVTIFIGGSYVLGRQVERRGWKVGYTRKALALVLYFLPYVAMKGPSPYTSLQTATISLGIFMLLLMSMSAPVRNRISIMATAFASIDRPEDRPLTLTWLITSTIAVWAIVYAWLLWSPETSGYLFVALFISGIGDALAEPVGLYFGKHSYETRALGTDRKYIRTLEGSATVFVSGVLAVLLVHNFQLNTQAIAALFLFPIAGTIAEAKSPHTWDQPFIIGSCALVAICLSFL